AKMQGWLWPNPTARGTVAAGVILAGVAMAVAAIRGARRRQLQYRSGEIQPLSSLWTTVDRCQIHASASARPPTPRSLHTDAPPVVLVHGFGVSSKYFLATAERLAPTLAVYAVDLPGHGQSDTPPQPLDISQLADALIA